jgi:mannosyltransferase
MALTRPAARRLQAPALPAGAVFRRSDPPPWLFALVPAVVTLVLGLWGLTRRGSMWWDEAATYDMARRDLPELLDALATVDAVHGLYYLLMHGVFAVFGDSLYALRLPSLLAMSAAAGRPGPGRRAPWRRRWPRLPCSAPGSRRRWPG